MQAESHSEAVKNILAQFPGPVVLRQEEYNQYYPLAGGLLLIALGSPLLWIVEWTWPPTRGLLAAVPLTIIGLHMVIGVARSVATGGMWMKLDAYGIEFRFWTRHEPRRWSWAAKDFAVMYQGLGSFVTFEDSAKAKWWELDRILSCGGRQRLPSVTDLSDAELAQLVNLWRARALTPAPANT
jgi:hypothetical protein